MKNEEKLIFCIICFNLIYKPVIFKRYLFLSYPYIIGYVKSNSCSNEIPVQTKCTVQYHVCTQLYEQSYTGFPKIWLTL
jgi:hypothetical protein